MNIKYLANFTAKVLKVPRKQILKFYSSRRVASKTTFKKTQNKKI